MTKPRCSSPVFHSILQSSPKKTLDNIACFIGFKKSLTYLPAEYSLTSHYLCLTTGPATVPDASSQFQLEGGCKHTVFHSLGQHREIFCLQCSVIWGYFLLLILQLTTNSPIRGYCLTSWQLSEEKQCQNSAIWLRSFFGRNAGHLMKRCTKARFLGANL